MTASPIMATPDQITDSNHIVRRSREERQKLRAYLPEMLSLERLLTRHQDQIGIGVEHVLHHNDHQLPLYVLTLGKQSASSPVLLLTAGMHGVERIGSQVLIAWLQALLQRARWDAGLHQVLNELQIVLLPILNPVGMYLNRRANGNGVDLNRNAPIDASDKAAFLAGGQRLTSKLPWYRGKKNAPMEAENQALQRVLARYVFTQPFALTLDLHSGFGTKDRLWFPPAGAKAPVHNIADYVALQRLWQQGYPHHNYVFEPQSQHYLTHGDVWDYVVAQSRQQSGHEFMALTLEMGSWAWVKKRPRQLLNFAGLFNPQLPHRHARVLRRHVMLLDFLVHAAHSYRYWQPCEPKRKQLTLAARNKWYRP